MPGINYPNEQMFERMIIDMRNQIRALATNQQLVISNLQGQPIIAGGLQPGSNPAEYGLGILSQAFGSNLAFFGEDASGNVGLFYFNPGNGAKVSQYDETGLHFFNASGAEVVRLDSAGLHVYDNGTERVAAGELANGDYGLQVIDANGNSEEILPAVSDYVDTEISVTSTTYVSDGGPSVTVDVGASGNVILSASSYIEPPLAAANTLVGGQVGLFIDGVEKTTILTLSYEPENGGQMYAFTNPSTTRIYGGLTPGSHTFELQYADGTGQGSYFSARSLIVTPI